MGFGAGWFEEEHAELGNVWHSFGEVEELTAKSTRLDEMTEAAGRDPASIRRASNLSLWPVAARWLTGSVARAMCRR